MIPYGRQFISDEDIEAVISVLRSDFLTQGPAVPAFERAVAEYCNADHALAVNSATSALHIACLALGAGPGDQVWTSPITFVASANCARYCGASVDFVDIDPNTFNMSVPALEAKLEQAERNNQLPRIVIPVHMAGQPCDMKAIAALGLRYGFRIIEDASHAVGARYRDGPVGNCRHSDITVFSFHPVKIITTAEGGLALTNDLALAEKMKLLRSHGVTRDPPQFEAEPVGPWYYEQQVLGFNYRMTDIQAALGSSQMKNLDNFVRRRRELAVRYDTAFADSTFSVQAQPPESQSSYHLYIIRLNTAPNSISHRIAFESLRDRGVGVNLHYMPVYLQPYYRRLGFQAGQCPEAERYSQSAISIPLYAGLTDEEQEVVIAHVQGAAQQ